LDRGCNPDIVLVRRRLAIWVDGCFWHGCPQHGRRVPWSGPNASLWEQKMERNRQRDEKAVAVAESDRALIVPRGPPTSPALAPTTEEKQRHLPRPRIRLHRERLTQPLQPLRNQASSTVWQGAMARRKHADHVL